MPKFNSYASARYSSSPSAFFPTPPCTNTRPSLVNVAACPILFDGVSPVVRNLTHSFVFVSIACTSFVSPPSRVPPPNATSRDAFAGARPLVNRSLPDVDLDVRAGRCTYDAPSTAIGRSPVVALSSIVHAPAFETSREVSRARNDAGSNANARARACVSLASSDGSPSRAVDVHAPTRTLAHASPPFVPPTAPLPLAFVASSPP